MRVNVRAPGLHAATIGLLNAVLQATQAFGVHMTATQDASITSLVNAFLVLVSLAVIQATNGAPQQGA